MPLDWVHVREVSCSADDGLLAGLQGLLCPSALRDSSSLGLARQGTSFTGKANVFDSEASVVLPRVPLCASDVSELSAQRV